MLQITPDKWLPLIKWVIEKRGIRFPGATLSKKMDVSKSVVSEVLNDQKRVSENFMETFLEHFPVSDQELEEFKAYVAPSGSIPIEEYIAEIKRHNAFLEKVIDSSLLNIGVSLNVIKERLTADHSNESERKGLAEGAGAGRVANTPKDTNVILKQGIDRKKGNQSRANREA